MMQLKDKLTELSPKRPIDKLPIRDPFQTQGYIQTEMKGWKKVFHENENQKKSGVAVLVSDKLEFKIKTVLRDKDGDQGINPRRIYNNFYIQNTRVSPQHLSFQ